MWKQVMQVRLRRWTEKHLWHRPLSQFFLAKLVKNMKQVFMGVDWNGVC